MNQFTMLTFTVCGGELTAMQGTIKSNGYPNIATRSRYEIESLY